MNRVIEWQMDDVLDINGWDLKKALRQFARGNATLFEWSGSPVVYKTTEDWRRIRKAAEAYFSEKAAACHYYGTANNTYHNYLCGEKVSYKKYFYALRPLLAAIYIERFHKEPPVLFDELLEMDLEDALRDAIHELMEKKKHIDENTLNPHMPEILHFIEEELKRQKQITDSLPDGHNKDVTGLNACFMDMIGRNSIPGKADYRIRSCHRN